MTDVDPDSFPDVATQSPPMSRREFARLASLIAAATACSSNSSVTAPTGVGVVVNGTTVTIPLGQNPDLTKADGFLVIRSAQVIVINAGGTYRAFSAICTHQACVLNHYDGSRMHCPCHGSQFATDGTVARGPATSPLRSRAVTLAGNTLTVSLT